MDNERCFQLPGIYDVTSIGNECAVYFYGFLLKEERKNLGNVMKAKMGKEQKKNKGSY